VKGFLKSEDTLDLRRQRRSAETTLAFNLFETAKEPAQPQRDQSATANHFGLLLLSQFQILLL
jgi:hypothetical protein